MLWLWWLKTGENNKLKLAALNSSIELEEWKNEIVFFKNLTEKKLYISVNLNPKRS